MSTLIEPTDIPPITLTNGFVAVQVYAQDNGENAAEMHMRRYTGTVLGKRKNSKGFHDYAVWTMWYDEDHQEWECNGGDYFDDEHQAHHMFGLKFLRNCWGSTLTAIKDKARSL